MQRPKIPGTQAIMMRGACACARKNKTFACAQKIKHKLSYDLLIKKSRYALMKHSSAPAKPEESLVSIRKDIYVIEKELTTIFQNKFVLPNRENILVVKLLSKFAYYFACQILEGS